MQLFEKSCKTGSITAAKYFAKVCCDEPIIDKIGRRGKKCLSALKAKLNYLEHAFCGTQINLTDFTTHRECFEAIKSLRSNDKIITTKPDKDSSVVILTNSDYIIKMNLILNDASKFQQIGPTDANDNTAKIEAKIQRRLLQRSNGGVMHESVYKKIRPTGSLRPRLYGLPKVHKKDVLF